MKHLTLLLIPFFFGCGLEPLLFSTLDNEPLPVLPDARPNVLAGYVTSLPGATVELYGSSGQPVASAATAGEDGSFAFELPGNTDFSGLHITATDGTRVLWGLAPPIAAQTSVLDGTRTIPMSSVPGMENLTPESTTLAFILLARSKGIPLSSDTLVSAGTAAVEALGSDPDVIAFHEMVLLLSSEEGVQDVPPFDPTWSGAPGTSPLNENFLKDGVDYAWDDASDVNDNVLETTTTEFDAALQLAADALEFEECTTEGWIRLVLMVSLQEDGAQDGNCTTLDPFLWASEAPGKQVFFTGGVHEDTPRCSGSQTTGCISQAIVDETHIALSAWAPNTIPMFDDGTHGDAIPGDGIWTRTFVVPWIPIEDGQTDRGVRLGYKYTYGLPGDLWTNTEEWPGNQRILEVADFNGDGLVVRIDKFGDEATNKDKKNGLSFANGGCGTNKWPEELSSPCHSDVWENFPAYADGCGNEEQPPTPIAAPVSCGEIQ